MGAKHDQLSNSRSEANGKSWLLDLPQNEIQRLAQSESFKSFRSHRSKPLQKTELTASSARAENELLSAKFGKRDASFKLDGFHVAALHRVSHPFLESSRRDVRGPNSKGERNCPGRSTFNLELERWLEAALWFSWKANSRFSYSGMKMQLSTKSVRFFLIARQQNWRPGICRKIFQSEWCRKRKQKVRHTKHETISYTGGSDNWSDYLREEKWIPPHKICNVFRSKIV